MDEASDLAGRWYRVKERLAKAAARSGRDEAEIRMVAVTKTVTPEAIREALALGLTELGENRVQEGLAKQRELGRQAAIWHLIGSLQTNKAAKAAASFDLIHGLDRLELAEALNRAGERLGRRVPVLVQVNVSGEASKHGLDPRELAGFLARAGALDWLSLRGLMTIAPLAADPEKTRPVFAGLRDLFHKVRQECRLGPDWQWLSMGMSQDFEVAIEEGANMVRIGTAIFGERGGR